MTRNRGRGWLVGLVAASLLLSGCSAWRQKPRSAPMRPWSYVTTRLPGFWWYDLVDIKGARAKRVTGAGRTVAIVDTGILPQAAIPVPKGVATCGTNPNDITDTKGHGTELAGIAVGRDTGGPDVTRGVAPDTSLVAIKIDCGLVTGSSLTRGVDAAIQHGPDVILLALGGYPTGTPDVHTALEARVRDNPGILFVVASVWDGQTYPLPPWTRLPNAIVVAAMTLSDSKTEVPFSDRLGDVWAPGRDVETVTADPKYPSYLMQGTSAAAAIVAGCAALVKQKQSDYPGARLKSALMGGAEPKPDLGPHGAGRVNCNRAIP